MLDPTWYFMTQPPKMSLVADLFKFVKIDFYLISDACVISGCQLMSTNLIKRRDSESIYQVMSWNDCAARCLGKSNCQFWTWHHGNSGKWANICALMSGYGSRWEDSNTISGARGCLAQGTDL